MFSQLKKGGNKSMRFNSKAYDKVFPRQTEEHEQVETSVETFRPSEDEADLNEEPDVVEPVVEEGGEDDGSVGELDSE